MSRRDDSDDDQSRLIDEANRKCADLRSLLGRLQQSLAPSSPVSTEAGEFPPEAHAWAQGVLERQRAAPTYIERLVAESIVKTGGNLLRAAYNMREEFDRALAQKSEVTLTQLLKNTIYVGLDKKSQNSRARRRSSRFRAKWRNEHGPVSYVLASEADRRRFVEEHQECITRLASGDSLQLRVVDVLAADGETVMRELEKFQASIFDSSKSVFENAVARIVVQSWSPSLVDSIRSFVAKVDRDEMRKNELYLWIRHIPKAPKRVQPGTIYGNWISTIPYPAEERECQRVLLDLWRGKRDFEMLTHDFFYGIHGAHGDPKIYTHMPINGSEVGRVMQETHHRLADIHLNHWNTTISDDRKPDVIEIG